MATIIAGRFDEQATAESAVNALRSAGFPAEHISSFYVAPAGQHARYRLGGDHDKSVGAEDSPKGTVAGSTTGGVIGAAVGAISTPLSGPIGAITGGLVGAHLGNLVGALGSMKDDGDSPDTPPIRHSGLLVAVCAPTESCMQRALQILEAQGAVDLESSSGRIESGDWQDFDPAATPQLISKPQAGLGAGKP